MKMQVKIELQECLRDSPKFRYILEQEEKSVDNLEQRLDKILKICTSMIEAGKTYVGQQSLFANSLWDLSVHFKEDPDVLSALNKLIHSLQEMNKFHSTLLDQASRTVLKNISGFIRSDIKSVRDYRHHFEKISTEYDNILLRNSQVSKSKTQEVEEVQNILLAVKSCFGHQTLNYVNSIYVLQSKKRHEILSTLLSYMHACSVYFHEGKELCDDLQPFFKKLAEEITNMRDETRKIEKEVENSHGFVSKSEMASAVVPCDGKAPRLEGYLFKRTTNAFKTWNRRWFYLFDNKLVYRRRSGDEHETVMEDDLRLCTVKPVTEGERRYCFEIVSPSKSHILQADSEEMYHLWIEALQKGIGAAIQRVQSVEAQDDKGAEQLNRLGGSPSFYISRFDNNNKTQKMRMWEQILKIPGNNCCADCKSPNPHWASINLGVLLCIECSGVHRSLGVHYSKVRSLTLDDWEPEVIKVMAELGNVIVNRIYEANVPEGTAVASENCTGTVREEWIRTKYVEKKYVKQLSEFTNDLEGSSNTLRKWGVKKTRRIARSKDKEAPGRSQSDDSRNILLFGGDVDLPNASAIDFNSDQESTDGEEGGYVVPCETPHISSAHKEKLDFLRILTGEEDIEKLNPNLLLYKASAAHNLVVMCQALASGADKNWINPEDLDRQPLHVAVLSGSVMACAYLLLNGSKINCQDRTGRTPLHLATEEGHTAQVCLFLKYKADQHIEDEKGNVPLSMAEQNEHADIVTLLRLGRLNEEMKDTESGISGDDMFNDVVRDFSRLAYSNPEKLQRTKNNDV